MITTAVILAAGRGSRLDCHGRSEEYSKPLLQVGEVTLLHRTVSACQSAGVSRIIVVTGFRHHLVERITQTLPGDITCTFNSEWQLSNGVSVLCARPLIGSGPFALLMSDHVFDITILSDLLRHDQPRDAVLAIDRKLHRIFDIGDATKVLTQGTSTIHSIGKQLSTYDAVDCGLFACGKGALDALDKCKRLYGDCSLSDGMAQLAQAERLHAYDIGDRLWQDVDTPEMLAHAEGLLR